MIEIYATSDARVVEAAPRSGRPAFTLLEVLVSLGILVVGLASVAALIPASGSILSEAGLADQSGILAANAHAELRTRQIFTAASFGSGASRFVVLGDVFPDPPFATPTFVRHPQAGQLSYQLGDDLDVGPNNAPVVAIGGVCYGATIQLSGSDAPAAGGPAIASVAVFKKPGGEVKTLTLTGSGGGVYRVSGPATTPLEQDADRRRFLSGCSWVLTATGTPTWLEIGTSWATQAVGSATPTAVYVAFSGTQADALANGGSLTVYGFDGLLRVDQRPVVLE